MGSLVPRPSSHWLAAMTLMIPPRGAVDTRPMAGSGRGAGRKALVGWAPTYHERCFGSMGSDGFMFKDWVFGTAKKDPAVARELNEYT